MRCTCTCTYACGDECVVFGAINVRGEQSAAPEQVDVGAFEHASDVSRLADRRDFRDGGGAGVAHRPCVAAAHPVVQAEEAHFGAASLRVARGEHVATRSRRRRANERTCAVVADQTDS